MTVDSDEKMTPQELARLQQLLEEHGDSAGRFAMLPSIFVALLGFGATLSPLVMGEMFMAILAWPLAAGLFWFTWVGVRLADDYATTEENLRRDLRDQTKRIVEGAIEKKWEQHGKYRAWYSFAVLDKEYVVDITWYTRFDVGDRVRLAVSSSANAVLAVEAAEEPAS